MPIDSLSSFQKYPEPGRLIAGHFLMNDAYRTWRKEGIQDWIILFTLTGEGYACAGSEKAVCRPAHVTLFKPHEPHEYGTVKGKEWEFIWAHFGPDLLETRYLPDLPLLIASFEQELTYKRIKTTYERLIQDYREQSLYGEELCQNALREILLLIAQKQHYLLDPRIEETLHLLAKRMKEPVKIEELAKKVGLSSSRLSHLFKEQTGRSIIEMLNKMRLDQAALLLEHTDQRASEVSREVGFQHYHYFAEQFRKQFGQSPRTFKRAKRDVQ